MSILKKALKSKLFSNTIVYSLTNALYTGLPLILLPFLIATLKPEDYGIVELFRSVTLVLTPLLGLSAVQAIGRFYYDLSDMEFKSFVTSVQIFQFFMAISALLLVLILSFWIKNDDFILLYLSIIYFFFNQLTESLLVVFRVKDQAKKYLVLRMLNISLELLIMFLLYKLLTVNDWTLRVYPIVVASVIIGFISFIIFQKEGFRIRYVKHLLIQGLTYSSPLILHMLSGYILNIGDRFLIKAFLPPEDLGNYAVAYQAGMAVNFFYTSFNLAWTPTFFQWMKENKLKSIAKIRKIVYVFLTALGGLIAVLWVFLFPIIDSSGKYTISIEIVLITLASYVILSFYKFETNYYLFNKETKKLSIYTLCSAILSIVLNLILIPKIGILGAAISTFLSFVCIYLLVLLNKKYAA